MRPFRDDKAGKTFIRYLNTPFMSDGVLALEESIGRKAKLFAELWN